MDITAEEQYNKDFLHALEYVKSGSLRSSGSEVSIDLRDLSEVPPGYGMLFGDDDGSSNESWENDKKIEDARHFLTKLEKLSAIKILFHGAWVIKMELLQPTFDNLLKEHRSVSTSPSIENRLILHLTPDSRLFKKGDDSNFYPLQEKSDRQRILTFIVSNSGFTRTGQIADFLLEHNQKEKKSRGISDDIASINKLAKRMLKIDVNIIESSKHGSYRISPKCEIHKTPS